MKKLKQVVLKLIVLCFVITGMTVTTVTAAPVRSPQLAKKNILIARGGIDTAQMKNVNRKVTWKSSNESLVRVVKTSGKYNQTAYLKAAGKTGKCTVTATVSGKSYSCKVIVRKGFSSAAYNGKNNKITFEELYVTPDDICIRIRRRNCTNEEAGYGVGYYVEKYVNGKWKKMTPLSNAAIPEITVILPAKTCQIEAYTITDCYKRSDFTKGKYRIYVDSVYCGKPMTPVNFTIK